MSQKRRSKLKIVLIIFGVIIIISAIANITDSNDNDSNIETPVVDDTAVNATQIETISVENQDRDIINESNVETDQQTLSYQMLNGSTWEGKEYGVWGGDRFSDDLQDIKLIFGSGGFTYSGSFTLTVVSSKLGFNGSFQHTGSYDIDDGEIVFHMKRGEQLYGKITGDIMTINWWYNKKFEVKR
jgi:hypothetical protein